MYLAKFRMDYCDEFNVYGYSIWDSEQFSEFENLKLKDDLTEHEVYFGTNEYFEATGKDFYDAIEISEITEDVANIISEAFGKEWGTMTPSEIVDIFNEQ